MGRLEDEAFKSWVVWQKSQEAVTISSAWKLPWWAMKETVAINYLDSHQNVHIRPCPWIKNKKTRDLVTRPNDSWVGSCGRFWIHILKQAKADNQSLPLDFKACLILCISRPFLHLVSFNKPLNTATGSKFLELPAFCKALKEDLVPNKPASCNWIPYALLASPGSKLKHCQCWCRRWHG